MEQPYENKNIENMNTIPKNQQVRSYKKAMRAILETAGDHYENYPYLVKMIEECSK